MDELPFDLDESYWNAVPTPSPAKVSKTDKENNGFTPTNKRGVGKSPLRVRNTLAKGSVKPEELDLATLFEGVEEWDMDAPIELTPVKLGPTKNSKNFTREPCTRCKVTSVVEEEGSSGYHKRLSVRVFRSHEERTVILQDDWAFTDVQPSHTVNIIGSFTGSTITITAQSNLLILHPDILLTPSNLSSAPQCTRKPLLAALVRSTGPAAGDSSAMIWGNMLHDVVQNCLRTGNWSEKHIDDSIKEVVRKGLADLVKVDVPTVAEAQRQVKSRSVGLKGFAAKYITSEPKDIGLLSNTRATNDTESYLAIPSLLDVEEDIWSPTYGLKGKLDATVDSKIVTKKKLSPFIRSSEQPFEEVGTKPLEIKTGRPNFSIEHRAQTMLYTLLLSERYNVSVPAGLLYYTQSDEVIVVPRGWNEIRGLLRARNEVAGYMFRRSRAVTDTPLPNKGGQPSVDIEEMFLPPPIDDEHVCKRCFVRDTCMLYRKTVEDFNPPDNAVLAEIYGQKTSHITPTRADFFKRWEQMLGYEEADLLRHRKELWTMSAEEREKHGRCFANMVLGPSPKPTGQELKPVAKIHQFTYSFVRSRSFAWSSSTDMSLLSGHINVGDPIVISVHPNLLALARGFVLELTPSRVEVGVDRPLDEATIRPRIDAPLLPAERVRFRIDKDELFAGFGRIRDNLAQLFHPEGDVKRLELVVDLRPPVFFERTADPSPTLVSLTSHLNASQRHAVEHVMRAQDYALILGMPGTGKTTIIETLIRCLVAEGKTVLLTSYTNSAVDNVLLKFVEEEADFGILRLGNLDRVHPNARRFSLAARKTPESVEDLERQLMSPALVATTCLSIDHPVFHKRRFDVCIVDEASQITLPTCIGPLRYANAFVLVGDHFQLPPLVRNPAAKAAGLDVSLFRRLSDSHPQAVVDLVFQYRMNEAIMELSNTLIYSNRLRCGSPEVAHRRLSVPTMTSFFADSLHKTSITCNSNACWLSRLVDPESKAVFVDTDLVPAYDTRVGQLVQNDVEADLVHQLTEALVGSGVPEEQIGVISMYQQQIKILRAKLQRRKEVEILTADKSQGRDKECIIVSLVRSNEEGNVGNLMKDWRRINVSFTRARSKLVIFGSRRTLGAEPLLKKFFELMELRGWIYRLPVHAHLMHASELGQHNKRMIDEIVEREVVTVPQTPRKKLKANRANGLEGNEVLKDRLLL